MKKPTCGFIPLGVLVSCLLWAFQKPESEQDLDAILSLLVGEFDNYQQVFAETSPASNTLLQTHNPHRHIHSSYQVMAQNFGRSSAILVQHNIGDDETKTFLRQIYLFNTKDYPLSMEAFDLAKDENPEQFRLSSPDSTRLPSARYTWRKQGNTYIGESRYYEMSLKPDTLLTRQTLGRGYFSNPEMYRLLRCHYFTGWVEIADSKAPAIPTRISNLRLHDQGAKCQIKSNDAVAYTCELAQLAQDDNTPILKLSIYKEAKESINTMSKPIADIWAAPESRRIGLNLQYIATNWDLERKHK
jgi:hypothetical protein